MSKKLGRNNPCWCGSGLKYKDCHNGRDRESRPTLEEAKNLRQKAFNKSYCLHPDSKRGDCEGNIVNSQVGRKSLLLILILVSILTIIPLVTTHLQIMPDDGYVFHKLGFLKNQNSA